MDIIYILQYPLYSHKKLRRQLNQCIPIICQYTIHCLLKDKSKLSDLDSQIDFENPHVSKSLFYLSDILVK